MSQDTGTFKSFHPAAVYAATTPKKVQKTKRIYFIWLSLFGWYAHLDALCKWRERGSAGYMSMFVYMRSVGEQEAGRKELC